MHTSKLTECLTSIVIFQYHLGRWCKLQIHRIGRTSDLSVGLYTQAISKSSTKGVKNDPHRFCPCNSYTFKICQSSGFYVVKQ